MTRTLPASDYRKRPVTVKVAGPLSKDNCVAIARWCGGWTHIANTLVIPTLEGDMHASFGDWIIQGVAGEFYPCKPEIFAKTYEPATAHETTPSDAAIAQATSEIESLTLASDPPDIVARAIALRSLEIHHRAREIEQGRELPELPRPTEDELWDQTLKERDAAEDALGKMFQAVTGRPAEWSSAWFFDDAIEEVEDHIAITEKSQSEVVRKALQQAYILGQRYWQQADSESYKQNKLADDTEAKFRSLQDDTSAAMSACRRMGNRDE